MMAGSSLPPGAGPPIDYDSDEDYAMEGTFDDFGEAFEDDEFVPRRRNYHNETTGLQPVDKDSKSQPEGVIVTKPLSFSSNKMQCKKEKRATVKWTPQHIHKVQRQIREDNQTEGNAGKTAFPRKPENEPEFMKKDWKFTDSMNSIDGVPIGSYEEDKRWLKQLEEEWISKGRRDHNCIKVILSQCWATVQNPYTTTLSLTSGAKDYCQGKTGTLSFTIVKEFEKWIKTTREKYTHCLNTQLKITAFQIAIKGHFTPLDMLVKAYDMKHEGNQYFLSLINPFLEKKRYKEAAQCITKLGLQSHYITKDIVIPLLLQDKINLIEAYVYQNRGLQEELLRLLDHLVDDDTNISEFIDHHCHVPDIRREKMTPKLIGKLAIRLMKLYNIPEDVCPNVTNERNLKGLRYLLHKKYVECSITPLQFEELMQTTVGNNEYLQEQLIDQILDYLDVKECVRWAYFYEVPEDKLPSQIRDAIYEITEFERICPLSYIPEAPKDSDDSGDESAKSSYYHSLSLPHECVHWVDTREAFMDAVDDLIKPGNMVGVDGEWRPSFGQILGPCKMSLLQLGLPDKVYLLDILTLTGLLDNDHWIWFADVFLCSEEVVKIGYGLEGDLRMFIHAVPEVEQTLQHIKQVVDLQIIHQQVCKIRPDLFKKSKTEDEAEETEVQGTSEGEEMSSHTRVIKKEERGLSELVKFSLGKPLDKGEQLSDWERRPLRAQQIRYAALDAFCLLEVYEALHNKMTEHNLGVDLLPGFRPKTKCAKKSKSEKRQQRVEDRKVLKSALAQSTVMKIPNPPKVNGEPIPVRQFSAVIDNMLQGLGRQLRSCGADVIILKTEEKHDKAGTIARKDNRVILTSGLPFMSLRSQVPEGMCYNVSPGKAKEQVVEVLEQFNLTVTEGDIFSRCQVCNGNEYLYVHPKEMKEAWNIKKKRSGLSKKSKFPQSQRSSVIYNPTPAEVYRKTLPASANTKDTENSKDNSQRDGSKNLSLKSIGLSLSASTEDKSRVEKKSESNQPIVDDCDQIRNSGSTERISTSSVTSTSKDKGGLKLIGTSLYNTTAQSEMDKMQSDSNVTRDSNQMSIDNPDSKLPASNDASFHKISATLENSKQVPSTNSVSITTSNSSQSNTWISYGRGTKMQHSLSQPGSKSFGRGIKTISNICDFLPGDRNISIQEMRTHSNSASGDENKFENAGDEIAINCDKDNVSNDLENLSLSDSQDKQYSSSTLKTNRTVTKTVKNHESLNCNKSIESANSTSDNDLSTIANATEPLRSHCISTHHKRKDSNNKKRSTPSPDMEYTIEDFLKRGDDDNDSGDSNEDLDIEYDHIDLNKITIGNDVPVQLDHLAESQFEKIDLFYVCATCGKVFWEGSHFEKVKSQFSHVLEESNETGKSLYDVAREMLMK